MFSINYIFKTKGFKLGDFYEIKLDFKKDDCAINVLATLLELQEGLENYNKVLTGSISNEIQVSSILLDIEKGSILTKIQDVVRRVPSNDSIENFINKPKDIIKKVVKEELKLILKKGRKKLFDIVRLDELTQNEKEIKLFEETKNIIESSELSSYGVKVSKEKLLKAAESVMKPIRESKNDIFIRTDREFNPISNNFKVNLEDTFKETIRINKYRAKMIIKKPVFVGCSKWELINDKAIEAEMQDKVFIDKIKNREVSIMAGDMLDCDFKSEIMFNDDYEIIDSKYYVLKVYDIVAPQIEKNIIKDELFSNKE